jgi:hypothetical protein
MAAHYLEHIVLPVIAGLVLSVAGPVSLPTGAVPAPTEAGPDGPIFKKFREVQWSKMMPELGEASPEIAILHVDAKTPNPIADTFAKVFSCSKALAFGK